MLAQGYYRIEYNTRETQLNRGADILVLTRNAAGILDGQVTFPDERQSTTQRQVFALLMLDADGVAIHGAQRNNDRSCTVAGHGSIQREPCRYFPLGSVLILGTDAKVPDVAEVRIQRGAYPTCVGDADLNPAKL